VLGAHPGGNNNRRTLWPDERSRHRLRAVRNAGATTGFSFRRVEQLRQVMVKYGDAEKQVWLTEFGWTTKNEAPGYEYGAVISEEMQAEYLTRALVKGRDEYPWMGVMFIWTLNHAVVVPPNDEKYPWSVIRGDWSPRPSYQALKNLPK
jgi:hypothetical protein